ncbi:hypothetical protein [Demequina globuliformis]|uniref:hypothetical protein n=1 Tax=Demequina globuliformis TaxID=676202 RepID=UPI00078607E5|nr:hypothetical protein [Demequina globuliformis]
MEDDFPTLGFLAAKWVSHHCVVPDGFDLGKPLEWRGWQVECAVNHYRVKPDLAFNPARPLLSQAFEYRRSQVVGPQKLGKGPWAASITAFEAVGPCLFAGYATGGEWYICQEHGCPCDFEYEYLPGEPMGMPRVTSLIQLLATSEDQVDNIYRPLQQMIRRGPLADQMLVREGFIRLPNEGRIDAVTASANSKLGAPINFAVMDETGLYTARNRLLKVAQTMGRNLGGMGGRSIETTNAWDPMDDSRAQQTQESRREDIYKFYRRPPSGLNYRLKRDRRKIHEFVYEGAPWVDLDAIEAEAAELLETDPTQAERFFGNKLVQGLGAFMPEALWDKTRAKSPSTDRRISLGFDGSRSGDHTALRAETIDGYRFTPTYGPDSRPTHWNPAEWPNERIPRGEVDAAVREMFDRYKVERLYIDPRHWETQADQWASEFGEDVVVMWPTNRIERMFQALTRYLEDSHEGLTSHDGDPTAKVHALAARKVAKPGDKYILGKPAETQKIDILMADVLAHEAAADIRALGAPTDNKVIVFRR